MFKNIVRSAVQNIPRTGSRSYAIYGPANYKLPTLDDIAPPCGSWQEANEKRQRRYNMHLIGGLLFTAGTIIFAKVSGLVYLNWTVPVPKEKK